MENSRYRPMSQALAWMLGALIGFLSGMMVWVELASVQLGLGVAALVFAVVMAAWLTARWVTILASASKALSETGKTLDDIYKRFAGKNSDRG